MQHVQSSKRTAGREKTIFFFWCTTIALRLVEEAEISVSGLMRGWIEAQQAHARRTLTLR